MRSTTTTNLVLASFAIAGLVAAACAGDETEGSSSGSNPNAGPSSWLAPEGNGLYSGGSGGTGGTGGGSGSGGGDICPSGGCDDPDEKVSEICGEYKYVINYIMHLYRQMSSRYTFMTSDGVEWVSGNSGAVKGWECLPTDLRDDVVAAGFSPGQCFPPGTTWSLDKAAVHEILAGKQGTYTRLPDGPDVNEDGIPDDEPYRISLKDLTKTGGFAAASKFQIGSSGDVTTLSASFLRNASAASATDWKTYAADAGESPFGYANGFGRCVISGAMMLDAGIDASKYDDAGLDDAGNTPHLWGGDSGKDDPCDTIGHRFYSRPVPDGGADASENSDYGKGVILSVTSNLDGGAYYNGGIVVTTQVISDRARYREWRRFLQYLAYTYVKLGWSDTPGGGAPADDAGTPNDVPWASSDLVTKESNVFAADGGVGGAYEMLSETCGGAIAKVWEAVGLTAEEMAAKDFIHGIVAHTQHATVRGELVHYFKRYGVAGLARAHGSNCTVSGASRGCSDIFLDPTTVLESHNSSVTSLNSSLRAEIGRGKFGSIPYYEFEASGNNGQLPSQVSQVKLKVIANANTTGLQGAIWPELLGSYNSTTPYYVFEALGTRPSTVKNVPFQVLFNGVPKGPKSYRTLAQATPTTGTCMGVLPCSEGAFNLVLPRE
ncbi:MAG: hypothetical protein U0169_12815 [Polyangiaceae bacterium]